MQGGLGGGTVSMRPGIDAGESYVREVAAFLLVGGAWLACQASMAHLTCVGLDGSGRTRVDESFFSCFMFVP